MNENRHKRLRFSGQMLVQVLRDGIPPGATCVHDQIPPDAHVMRVREGDLPGDIDLLLWSIEFPEVAEGTPIPEIRPQFASNPTT